ncbi:MAG: S-adenosylmethionine:tRNA ribosyltransferase-isomerase [Sodalis sp. Ffu]|nr:MAG: S-adenosylmethionine:tRNA ribosyltransferase-isomerase [Sodalis sp. Ffu]
MAFITLHVGAGTFQSVRLDGYRAGYSMYGDMSRCGKTVVDAMLACKARGNLVIAVGTTSVRSLENTAMVDENRNLLAPFFGDPYIFIFPGYRFRVIDALITNFYLPESTLIMLVAPLPVIVIPVLPNQALKVWVVIGMVLDLPSGVNPSDVGG